MSEYKPNPYLQQFRSKLEARTVLAADKQQLEKFRNGAKRTPEDRALADELLAECASLGDEEIGRKWQETYGRREKPASKPGDGRKDKRPKSKSGAAGAHGKDHGGDVPRRLRGGEPSHLGEAFHNPYTFLPFPARAPHRRTPTPFTIDEAEPEPIPSTIDEKEPERFTGIVELELKTLSPLMTCKPEPENDRAEHPTHRALSIGNDVVVPATGVKGSLRTLMTILAGGTLGYLDDGLWLVQGRDVHIGPVQGAMKRKAFLGRVVSPGTATTGGTIEVGDQDLVPLTNLQDAWYGALPRPVSGRPVKHLWSNARGTSLKESRDDEHEWQVKLSGKPVGRRGVKKEGVFRGSGRTIELPAKYWSDYLGRHRHSDHPELKKDDLVWLEPFDANRTSIGQASQIKSLQWARWGREGESLAEVVQDHHPQVFPDCLRTDGKVDEITDLFGQVPMRGLEGAAGPFRARIRPDNLVFEDGVEHLRWVTLAPLSAPHPGCAAFYRDASAPDDVVSKGLPLRGYKVYRTTSSRGPSAPWLATTQGAFDVKGRLETDQRKKTNRTCALLQEGLRGVVRLACHGLSRREVALLLLACSVDWRLGGGKPLGLGLCRPTKITGRDELGEVVFTMERKGDGPAELPSTPEDYASAVSELLERRAMWHQSQLPVSRMRYPRAVNENKNRKQRGGHVWFGRHATLNKSKQGLQVLWLEGNLAQEVGDAHLRGQQLPSFDPKHPDQDLLFAYDLYSGSSHQWQFKAQDGRTFYKNFEAFDPDKHARDSDASGGPAGQTAVTRQAQRDLDRTTEAPQTDPADDA